MSANCIRSLQDALLSVNYRRERLRTQVPLPFGDSRTAEIIAYADQPFDARTSTICVITGKNFPESDLGILRPLGTPIIAQCFDDHALFWKQEERETAFIQRVSSAKILSFFREHREELSPEAVYRAKAWARVDKSWQLEFVDEGLLPVVEEAAGSSLRNLLEQAVTATKAELGWRKVSDEDGKWLLKSVFWLLAAKILQDKGVQGFARLDFFELEKIYQKLAQHYNKHDPRPVQINGSARRNALLVAADMIHKFGHCGAVTTESLAWVYESALIDRETRQRLGTHSTPTWLVDEIVVKLRPWIEEMDPEDRYVFEPACGHAGFLISAMRVLSDLLPSERAGERKTYLRKRLHGIEVDSFAYEVAKLSLTLADVPNDNGWMLDNRDMFSGNALQTAIQKAKIVLANPPFEKFTDKRARGSMHGRADETFRQIVDYLPPNGVFGVVMPQAFLHSTQASNVRHKLLSEYEISEITLFADKIFNYGEPETAVILGRRLEGRKKSNSVLYRTVREEQVVHYAVTHLPTQERHVPIVEFEEQGGELFSPELGDIWRLLAGREKLKDFASGGKGFDFKGADALPEGRRGIRENETRIEGFVRGFTDWREDQATHELPRSKWLNLSDDVIATRRYGTEHGIPQVLLNYARVSRGPWRLKALLDAVGHPFTSRFLAFRPREGRISLKALWAILNSPIANAYAYSHSSKRDVLTGTMRDMPMVSSGVSFKLLDELVTSYFAAAKGKQVVTKKSVPTNAGAQLSFGLDGDSSHVEAVSNSAELRSLHWQIDAEVLRLYALPADAERQILQLFSRVRRRGVPFFQDEYLPTSFDCINRLSDLVAITSDWQKTNRRRCFLIKKDVKDALSDEERNELDRLESLADARLALLDIYQPNPPSEIERTMQRLKREGRWPLQA